ncbi:MAG: methyltransferase, TrmH family, group 3 [Fibrobacteria bacterium]|jgi:23S rRNA (guanosine2251-2'-O)-methyltransferase|nr:methyltransferase, TrmH family, group 3 [Fibrobacteria bacterium]
MPRRIDNSAVTGGLRAVEELVRTDPRRVRRVVFQLGSSQQKLYALQKAAEDAGIQVQQLPKGQLDAWFPDGPHQGVLAFCESRSLEDWNEVRARLLEQKRAAAAGKAAAPLIIVPAAFEDPRNLGAGIRSAVGLGADAILLPGKGSTGLTPAGAKAAAGTENAIPVCRAQDIAQELKGLAAEGFAVLGLDAQATRQAHTADLTGPLVLVAGGEDRGIPPHIARCLTDRLLLPMAEGCHSYNASVALALLLYEAARQRGFSGLNKGV